MVCRGQGASFVCGSEESAVSLIDFQFLYKLSEQQMEKDSNLYAIR